MKAHRPITTLLAVAAFTLCTPTHATADGGSKRKKLTECVNKELEQQNKEWKLSAVDLKKFTKIVDDEIAKEPLKKHTTEEQQRILKDIEEKAKRDLPKVPKEKIDKMLMTLTLHAMHCTKEMGS
ncbi:hypothetical protein [Streptomyces sp. YGL11-2]|uniref:hypothetical protein n=1 Tax=Streptomyces sp. YGL11-2 TaxID=3414028 RepID=UPI003CF08C65